MAKICRSVSHNTNIYLQRAKTLLKLLRHLALRNVNCSLDIFFGTELEDLLDKLCTFRPVL